MKALLSSFHLMFKGCQGIWWWLTWNYFLSLDMRKALSRDKEKKSVIPMKDPVRPEDIE